MRRQRIRSFPTGSSGNGFRSETREEPRRRDSDETGQRRQRRFSRDRNVSVGSFVGFVVVVSAEAPRPGRVFHVFIRTFVLLLLFNVDVVAAAAVVRKVHFLRRLRRQRFEFAASFVTFRVVRSLAVRVSLVASSGHGLLLAAAAAAAPVDGEASESVNNLHREGSVSLSNFFYAGHEEGIARDDFDDNNDDDVDNDDSKDDDDSSDFCLPSSSSPMRQEFRLIALSKLAPHRNVMLLLLPRQTIKL